MGYEEYARNLAATAAAKAKANEPKLSKNEERIKKTLDNLYPAFINFCEANKNVHRKNLFIIFIVQVINSRHIYRKWNKTFQRNKCFVAERFKNSSEMIFEDYTMTNGILSTRIIKLWESFSIINFETRIKALEKAYVNINNLLATSGIGKRVFNREIEINGWYNNVCEYYSYNACTTLVSHKSQSALYPCTIKFLLKYNQGLSSYDVNRYITVILRHRVLHKLVFSAIAISNSNPKNISGPLKAYGMRFEKLFKVCKDLIIKSNASVAAVCDQMMRCCLLCLKDAVDQINDLIAYRKKITITEKIQKITDIHKEIIIQLLLAQTYLSLLILCAKEEDTPTGGAYMLRKLGREYGVACCKFNTEICAKFNKYIGLMSPSESKSRMSHMEKTTANILKVNFSLLTRYFAVVPTPKVKKNLPVRTRMAMMNILFKVYSNSGMAVSPEA